MRLEISRKTHLALEAIWVLDEVGKRIQGSPLASAIGTSAAFLAQVMSPLVRNGWVDSVPGRTGGYSLAVDPESISVLELIEAIEGPTDESCALRGGMCAADQKCAIHDAWTKARIALMDELARRPVTSIPRQGAL